MTEIALTPELEYFNRYFNPARRHQQALAAQWQEYEKGYLGEPSTSKPSGVDSWRSFVHYKYAHQQVHTLAAELAADDDPIFTYEGRTPLQDEYADTAESIIKYQLERDDYTTKRLMAIVGAAVYGGQPVKVMWKYKCVTRKILKPSGLREVTEIVVDDQPTICLIDPHDFFYDVRARNMAECRYVFHRMRLTIEELESKKRSDGSPLYTNLEDVRKSMGSDSVGDASVMLDNDLAGERSKARRNGIEVIEMWTKDRVLVRAGGGTIIRDEENPYDHGRLPFEVLTLMPSLNDVWGQSMLWLLRDIQELLWTLDNAQIDALKLSINPPLAVDVTADHDNINKELYPGQRFPGRGEARQIVEPIKVTGIELFASDQAIQAQRGQMEYISGITKEMAGNSDAGTATQAALNQRQAKGRIGVMLHLIDQGFARCAEMMLQLNQQYLDMSKPQKLLGAEGAEWRHISPVEIAGIWDVSAKASGERAVEELRRQNLLEALQALQPMNGLVTATGKTINFDPILEEIAESYKLPKEQLLVDAQMMYEQQAKQTVAQGEAQGAAQVAAEQQQPPVDPAQNAQHKMFESLNYKDLPAPAKAAMLQQAGLPPDGAGDPTQDPAAPEPPDLTPSPLSQGLGA